MDEIDVKIVTIRPEYAKALEELQLACYPTLGPNELMREEHFLMHCRLFPEGSYVAIVDNKIVGLGSGFFINFDFDNHHHTFNDIIAGGYYTNHDPNGEWYYGADISVHPDYRGCGIGRWLYHARKSIVKKYNRRGIVAGGLIPGYQNYKHQMSAHEYVQKVVNKELFDRTLTFQLRNGFTVRGVIENYIHDTASDNWATLIVWENPDYVPQQDKAGV